MKSKTLIIIPTYNESQNIERLIREILLLPGDYDLLVIDDNSPDGTADIVENLKNPPVSPFLKGGEEGDLRLSYNRRINLLKRPSKLGLGTAYLTGFQLALEKNYDYVFTMDADFSHQPKYIPEMSALLENCDLVIGSRYVDKGGVEGWPLKRRILSGMGNFYARTVTGIPAKDCTSGFMGMKMEFVEYFINENIHSEGYVFLIELKNIAFRKKFTIKEYPIIFIDRIAGKSKISKKIIFEALLLVWKLRLKSFFPGIRGNRLFKIVDKYAGIPFLWFAGLFLKKRSLLEKGYGSILVVKLSALGDTILLIPAIRSLRKKYPRAKITALGTKINQEVLNNCPYIDEVIIIDINKLLIKPFAIISEIRKRKIELAIDFDQWLRVSAVLCLLSGAKYRLGFKTNGQMKHYAFTHYVEHTKSKHEIESFFDIVNVLGAETGDKTLEFSLNPEGTQKAEEALSSMGINDKEPFVIFHPETPSHGGQRQWPSENYIELGKKLYERYKLKVVITGTKKDMISNRKLVWELKPFGFLFPPVNLRELSALFSKSRLLVCGNTGIMHLACALNVPVISLHGPTNPQKWGPISQNSQVIKSKLNCSPCLYLGFEYGCSTNRCMQSITPVEVFEVIAEKFADSLKK